MNKNNSLLERVEFRLTKKEKRKLRIRAKIYADGDVSKLLRYWIEFAPVPGKGVLNVPNDQTNISDPRESGE